MRGTVPMRDTRFITFSSIPATTTRSMAPRAIPSTATRLERLTFIRSQRDEVDAIEAFGTFLYDIRNKNLRRRVRPRPHHLGEEARHTEIGHRAMLASGFDPFELPNRLTSSVCRGPMAPEFGMAEINLFGEVGVMKTISGLFCRAEEHGEPRVSRTSPTSSVRASAPTCATARRSSRP